MKKALLKYWPLLAGVTALAVFYFLLDGKAILAKLLGGAAPSSAQPVARVPQGVVSIDPNEITMEVLPSPGVPVIPRMMAPSTFAADPVILPVKAYALEGYSPPYVADSPPIIALNPSLNV